MLDSIFGHKKEHKARAGDESVVDSGPSENSLEVIMLSEQPESGQTWIAPDDSKLHIIEKSESGRFVVFIKDMKGDTEREQKMSPEELTARLLTDEYKLSESLPVAVDYQVSVPEVVQETISTQDISLGKEGLSALDTEYLVLKLQVEEVSGKIENTDAAIKKTLEDNADAFGSKYGTFFEQRDTFAELINDVIDEDNNLDEIINVPDQEITKELLEKKKANHRELLGLFAALESLESEVVKHKDALSVLAEVESMVLGADETERVENLSETGSPSLTISPEETVPSSHEQAIPVSSDVTANSADRKEVVSEPTKALTASPFVDGSLTGEVTRARRSDDEQKKKSDVDAKALKRQEREKRQRREFLAVSKALKVGQEFAKDNETLLVIKTITDEEIGYEYRKSASDKWHQDVVRPGKIKNFSEYLKDTFGWALRKNKTEVSKPRQEKRRIRKDMVPIDKDDEVRASQTETLNYEERQSVNGIKAAEGGKRGQADDDVRPEKETQLETFMGMDEKISEMTSRLYASHPFLVGIAKDDYLRQEGKRLDTKDEEYLHAQPPKIQELAVELMRLLHQRKDLFEARQDDDTETISALDKRRSIVEELNATKLNDDYSLGAKIQGDAREEKEEELRQLEKSIVVSRDRTSILMVPERPYKELEKSFSVMKKKQCASIVSEGLAPLARHMEQNDGVTLQSLVDQIGIEKIVQNVIPSIVAILPTGTGLNEKERLLFVSEFVRREIVESLE